MTATKNTDALIASARASRMAAAKFREQVERLRGVSFEGSLAAIAEFRLMAQHMNDGLMPKAARSQAQAALMARHGAPASYAMAAE